MRAPATSAPESPAAETGGTAAAPRSPVAVSAPPVSPQIPRIVRLLGPLVGLFFLVYPITTALEADPGPLDLALTLGGAGLFTAIFLWLFWRHEPLQLVPATSAEIGRCRAAFIFLTVLAIAISFVLNQEWRVLFFHLNIAAGLILLTRDAYVAIGTLAVIQFALGLPTGLWWLVVPMGALGLWATAFISQIGVAAELRAAREALARRAVAEERLRFARDLHDLLGHSLSLITLKSELAGKLLPTAPERAAVEIREAEVVARRALREVREAVAGYRQPTLVEELHEASEILAAAGIAARIEHEVGILPKSLEALLAWAVREGATNVIRHSRAQHCTIRLIQEGDAIFATIDDDGRGAEAVRERGEGVGGSGLVGLAERVAAVPGAQFAAGPLPGGGFRLRVSLPLADDHEEMPR